MLLVLLVDYRRQNREKSLKILNLWWVSTRTMYLCFALCIYFNQNGLPTAFTQVSCSAHLFDPEDGGDMFLRDISWHSTDYTALYPRRESSSIYILLGCAQAVSHWLPTAAARVRSHFRSCGICGGQSGTGAGFLRVLRFPLPILIPPTAP
jgi:hypothetical protein